MPEKEHTKYRAYAAHEKRRHKQRSFADAPLAFPGFVFVRAI